MVRVIKVFFILVGVLIALLAVVLAGATAYFKLSDPRPSIERTLDSQTGWQFHLQGPVSLAFVPHLKVKAGDVLVDHVPGFSEPLLKAGLMDLSVKSIPLIVSKQLDPDYFYLANASINLHKNGQGQVNWLPQPGKGGAQAKQVSASSSNSNFPAGEESLKSGDFVLKNIKFLWRDDQSSKNFQINNFNLNGKLDMFCSLEEPETCLPNIKSQGRIDITGIKFVIPRQANSTLSAVFNAAHISGDTEGSVKVVSFDSAGVNYQLKQGVVTFDKLQLLAKTQVLQGRGQVNLLNRTINADMAVAKPGSEDAFKEGLVFHVSGSIDSPQIVVDQASIQRYVKKKLGNKVNDMLHNFLNKNPKINQLIGR